MLRRPVETAGVITGLIGFAIASAIGGAAGSFLVLVGKMERIFERSAPDSDPQWMSYVTAEELAGEMLHCFTDLGMPREARAHSALALAH